jgi:hypothetical protein
MILKYLFLYINVMLLSTFSFYYVYLLANGIVSLSKDISPANVSSSLVVYVNILQ